MTSEQVISMLSGLKTHVNEEFIFLGEALYLRKDIDQFAPYKAIRVPDEPRNRSAYEPDLINK